MLQVLLELLGLFLEILVEATFEFLAEAVGAVIWRVLLESFGVPEPTGARRRILHATTTKQDADTT